MHVLVGVLYIGLRAISSPVLCFADGITASDLLNVCVCNDDIAMVLRW